MFSSLNRSDTYDTLRWYCNSKGDLGQLGALLNDKASDAKKVRDSAIVTLESLDTSRILRLYATKVQTMFDDTLGRDSIRRVLGLYREIATFAENTGKAKDSGKCEFIAAPADNVKYLSFLLPVYKTIDRFLKYSESDDEKYDKVTSKFFGLGNGKPYPETDESAQQLCNSPAANVEQGDVGTVFRYYASFGSKAQPMFHALNTTDTYTRMRWFCIAKDQDKLGQTLNAKLSEAQKLRDTAIATLESLDTNRSTIADALCIVNLYETQTEALFDGTLARDSVGIVGDIYRDIIKCAENMTKLKASQQCELIADSADNSKYMSFLTPIFKTLSRFLKSNHIGQLNCNVNQSQNLQLIDDCLAITAVRQTEQHFDKEYTSAKIKTKIGWTFGRFEIRAALPKGKMLRPAIVMEPLMPAQWALGGQIDVMANNQLQILYNGVHFSTPPIYKPDNSEYITTARLNDFHTYAVEWTKSGIDWYFDGHKHHSFNLTHVLSAQYTRNGQPFVEKPFRIVINLGVGGVFFPRHNLSLDDVYGWECPALIIDYVRVYQTDSDDRVVILNSVRADRESSAGICARVRSTVRAAKPWSLSIATIIAIC
ncbi:unnamed protein product, partial [Medioppia subpectinata]